MRNPSRFTTNVKSLAIRDIEPEAPNEKILENHSNIALLNVF